MRIDPFHMERTQSVFEDEVEFNLSESGVLPLKVEELLAGVEDPAALGALSLKYPPSNGSKRLRDRIAQFYAGATRDNVLVTSGGSKANYTTFWALLEKGDRAAVMLPNYMQAWGLARAYGSQADPYHLVEHREGGAMRWALDTDSLRRAVTKRTRLILVTNPNNPSGGVLTGAEMEEIIRAARRVNAWIVADEIYRGAEVAGPLSPTFWGRYDKVIVTSGLSKAFGLPGLRIGWAVGPAKTIARLWSYQDYTTLTPTLLSDHLASIVMEPARREAIFERTRAIIRRNLPRLEGWIHSHGDLFTYIPPLAGAIALVRYDLPIASVALFDRLRRERSVLIMPGGHFGIGKYLRIGYGYDIDYTLRGLARVDLTLRELQEGRSKKRAGRADGRAPRAASGRTAPGRALRRVPARGARA
ncbi:MAG TPA: aminotransferase class I/II-fold pyridoxal phosphate-dependent enzyme [Candidatus Polarisedimenticolia bacterium]|nr:aminotransferase class I/II-fold pyridoxal phosphate-dependent enzyme [Candidatus Polarisedimenticolia bacterium]